MEHVVFYPTADGAPAFERVPDLDDAVRFVEHLRNDLGITDATVHALTPVPVAFKTYYRVEVQVGSAAPSIEEPPASAEEAGGEQAFEEDLAVEGIGVEGIGVEGIGVEGIGAEDVAAESSEDEEQPFVVAAPPPVGEPLAAAGFELPEPSPAQDDREQERSLGYFAS